MVRLFRNNLVTPLQIPERFFSVLGGAAIKIGQANAGLPDGLFSNPNLGKFRRA
jgi:hypothetical protein